MASLLHLALENLVNFQKYRLRFYCELMIRWPFTGERLMILVKLLFIFDG